MTVCRYFLQGTCRFGERCRFEHLNEAQQNRNYSDHSYGRQSQNYNNRDRSSRYHDYSYSANYQVYDSLANNRYSSQHYVTQGAYYASHQNDDRYRGKYNDDDYDSYNSQSSRFSETLSQRNNREQRYSSNVRSSESAYGQNRFRWLASDYTPKQQVNKSFQSDYQTSTPKASTSFSFKVPESEIKAYPKSSKPHEYHLDENDQKYLEILKEDATAWELGEQWPFSCYFPATDKAAFPGFNDISPEELRYEAYKAKENNSYNTYVETVNNALLDIKQRREQLKVPTADLLTIISKIRKGEDLSYTSTFAEPSSLFQNEVESMASEPISTAASNFSFKLPTQTESTVKSSASFSFKMPSQIKSTNVVQDTNTENYTPLEQLTDSEKEQFVASIFTLGKIPTNPPPLSLCF